MFTDNTKWSYGNTFGRFENAWLQNRSYQYSQEKFINEIAIVGYKYIYLNRKGFSDNGNQMIDSISKNPGQPYFGIRQSRMVLFDINPYLKRIIPILKGQVNYCNYPHLVMGRSFFNQTPFIGQIAKIPIPSHINLFNPSSKKQVVEISFAL